MHPAQFLHKRERLEKEEEEKDGEEVVPETSDTDEATIQLNGGVSIPPHNTDNYNRIADVLDGNNQFSCSFLDGGEHFEDVTGNNCRSLGPFVEVIDLPRTHMVQQVHMRGFDKRPRPRSY